MDLFEILIIAVGLSMDAFAVSIGKGLSAGKVGVRRPLIAGVWFGGFQAFMPLVGYLFCPECVGVHIGVCGRVRPVHHHRAVGYVSFASVLPYLAHMPV